MKNTLCLTAAALGLAIFNISAATLYVSLESSNPVPPFATWATAATNIQHAVDAAHSGDTVLVTNGVYVVGGLDGNRVSIKKVIQLESVNGPLVTTIDGGGNVRGVYLGSNAILSGFTLINGVAGGAAGGVYCESSGVVTNCVINGNYAFDSWNSQGGGAYGGTLYDCTLTSNYVTGRYAEGGGAARSILYNCTLSGNSGRYGGGAYSSTLYNCTIKGNSGGGVWHSDLYNCTVTGNSGGGANFGCTLYNCTITGNSDGGVAKAIFLYNCLVTDNDGDSNGQFYNCTVVGNNGGVSGTVFNSIVYGNTNGNYTEETIFNYCLTTPLPTNGVGNITADPSFVNAAAGNFHLRPNSPCIDAGTNLLSLIQTDLDGEYRPWDGNRDGVAAFDLGAYEFRPSTVTLYVSLQSSNPTPPYATWATAATNIQHAVDVAKAGDTVLVTNGVYAVGGHSQTNEDGNIYNVSRVSITNAIRLESVNGPLVTTIVGVRTWTNAVGEVEGEGGRCVYLGANAVLSGFTLTNGASGGGGGVFSEPSGVVTNCTLKGNYVMEGRGGGAFGGSLYNCTLTGNWSVPYWYEGRISAGGGAYGCTLYNCTLTDNYTDGGRSEGAGGGASASTLYNCTLTDNYAKKGGGASTSTLYNCTLVGNSANWFGGGAFGSTLYNCTLSGNSASSDYDWDGGVAHESNLYNCTVTDNSGWGAAGSTLYNCTVTGNDGGGVRDYYSGANSSVFNSIIYYNFGGNYAVGTTLNYSCTTPLPTNGVGNITGHPLFMDMAAGDYRLREESPCIDGGTNLMSFPMKAWRYVEERGDYDWVVVGQITEPTDMLGNTRFIDGNFDGRVAWDMGAYEFNSFKPPQFTCAPQRMSDCWRLNITGAPNKWVHLQRSSDLKNWEDIWSGWMGAAGIKQVDDTDMSQKAMFYRAVVE